MQSSTLLPLSLRASISVHAFPQTIWTGKCDSTYSIHHSLEVPISTKKSWSEGEEGEEERRERKVNLSLEFQQGNDIYEETGQEHTFTLKSLKKKAKAKSKPIPNHQLPSPLCFSLYNLNNNYRCKPTHIFTNIQIPYILIFLLILLSMVTQSSQHGQHEYDVPDEEAGLQVFKASGRRGSALNPAVDGSIL
ncbi:hypothetical protein E2P81_ATG00765 [Venturia nashicola]|uniref:Uncharacterized protein n=1 Tax=Venturia nashicola TaxID=86259 RepID=A0A4Z1PBY6_9PEZI|nr:hypothetical protein E6O75_ATG00783 [Venturia nashicola]TLD38222.1 hypothetical protein E2P81_ATG00765 [Venturia nashicola]